ncbi:MAG: glycosylase [Opitutae bacterium]|nr:glycosylase [Opitutae bacterium]
MFKWRKMGLVINPQNIADKPEWFDGFAQAPNSIMFDNYVRIYFCCRPKPDANKQFVSYGTYVDLNRKNLFEIVNMAKEPILKLGGLGAFDEFGTYPVSVIKAGPDVFAYYGGWTRCESVPFNISLGLAKSTDGGNTFEKIGRGPVLAPSLDEPFVVTSPKIRKYGDIWYLAYTAGNKWMIEEGRPEVVYKLRMACSPDGINWTKLNKNIVADKLGEDEAQACPDIIFQNGKYHMFFCYREATNFRFAKERTYRIGYAWSLDMLDWTRDDSKVGIDVSDEGWDSEMVAYPHLFELEGAIYMLYLGNQVGRYGIGLAKLDGCLE